MSDLPISWPADGLIPVVIQDDTTDAVLMTGFMNRQALETTRSSGEVHFWSRSRNELWHKGGSSGHVQKVRSIAANCDLNSLLIRVEQIGAVCHDGFASCYYRDLLPDGSLVLNAERLFDPRDVYGDGNGLYTLTRRWWGAYEYLRDHDLGSESSTSARLRQSGSSVVDRVRDELRELAGVLDGSHLHSDQKSDAILEASQCAYWIAIECIVHKLEFESVRPDRAMDVPEATVDALTASLVLRAEAQALQSITSGVAMHLLRMIAEAVRTLSIDPRDVIESDVAALAERPYLAEFFAR